MNNGFRWLDLTQENLSAILNYKSEPPKKYVAELTEKENGLIEVTGVYRLILENSQPKRDNSGKSLVTSIKDKRIREVFTRMYENS